MSKSFQLEDLYTEGKGGIVVVQGATGHGRSRYTQHLMYEERKKGLNTLYLSSEVKPSHAHAMQVSKHMFNLDPKTALGDNAIIHKRYDTDQATALNEAMVDMNKHGFGQYTAEYHAQITLDTLEQILTAVWEDDQPFDFVVIDDLSLLGSIYVMEDVLAILNQLSKTFKGVGFKGVVTVQLAKGGTEVLKFRKDTQTDYHAITLKKVDNSTVQITVNNLTKNEVIHEDDSVPVKFAHSQFGL